MFERKETTRVRRTTVVVDVREESRVPRTQKKDGTLEIEKFGRSISKADSLRVVIESLRDPEKRKKELRDQ